MEFLHKEIEAGPEDFVEVILDHPANVQLLDPTNYDLYQRRQPYKYVGGHAGAGRVRIRPPRKERWHLVVDLGGGAGKVSADVSTSGLIQ